MKKYIIIIIALLLVTGCGSETKNAEIYTTIYPITYITDELIGDEIVVKSILPNNVDIHDFELKPSDLTNISNSKLFIDLGYNIVFDTSEIKKSIGTETTFLSLDKYLDETATTTSSGNENVHIWLDPINMISMSSIIKDELIGLYPSLEKEINENYNDLVSDLNELDIEYVNALSNVSINTIITTHDAFSHLDKYGVSALSIYDESHSSEPTQQELNTIIDTMNEKAIKYVVVENQNELSNVSVILNETNSSTVILYDLSASPINNDDDYIDVMEDNLITLRKILNK